MMGKVWYNESSNRRFKMPHYKLTSPSGKVYHGITVRKIEARLNQHANNAKLGKDFPLYRAIRKYGMESFKIEILSDSIDITLLRQLEADAIAADKSYVPNGYNATLGGEGTVGRACSKESRDNYRRAAERRLVRMKEHRANRTPDQVAAETANRAAATKKKWSEGVYCKPKTEEQLAVERANKSAASKASWVKSAKTRAEKTPEQKAAEKANRSAATALMHASLTDAQRAERNRKRLETRAKRKAEAQP